MEWEQEAPVLNLCKNSLFILPPLYISFTMNKMVPREKNYRMTTRPAAPPRLDTQDFNAVPIKHA